MTIRTRLILGTLIKDVPAYLSAFARGGNAYLAIRNRNEHIEPAPDASGFKCDWQWTSDLHAPKVLPILGLEIMRRALRDHPIKYADRPCHTESAEPQVSFLIGHRGMSRLPHLLYTLRTIAAQQDASIECVVVEQDMVSVLGPHLPPWVRLIHTPPPDADMPYCRSWTFNVAARHARGKVLVLHDNDMLVPDDYAAQIVKRVEMGYDAVNLKRFIFYLTPNHTQDVFAGSAKLTSAPPQVIVQNLEAGGSVAITRAGFDQIGGMDESFIGWGGEDNEFWERAQTLRAWPWANLPIVHLHHTAQPGKHDAQYPTAHLYQTLAQVAPAERIRRLRATEHGNLTGPVGWPLPAPAQPT